MVAEYKKLSKEKNNIEVVDEINVIKYLIMSDIMISDTSSVVYEFLLLDKPVITFKSFSKNIKWEDVADPHQLIVKVRETLEHDRFKSDRKWFIENYHPYTDGQSSKRMVDTVEDYIKNHTVPESRKIPWHRRRKMIKMFGNVT
jgi:CDP-glycerol glycerophosphotransferase (TagB/SpsB family)